MTIEKDSISYKYVIDDGNNDVDLLNSFKETFPDLNRVTTVDQILTIVNINSGIRDWYFKYKQFRSTFLVKPDWLPNDVESLDDWAKLKDKLAGQKKLFRDWDARVESKSKALKAEIEAVSSEKTSYFRKLDPLLVINSLTVNNLPVDDALEIALEGDLDLRAKLVEKKVFDMKTKYYLSYKVNQFVNPYLK